MRQATVDDVEGCLDLITAVVDEGQWLGMQPPLDRAERRERLLGQLADERCVSLVVTDGEGCVKGHLGLHVAPYGVADLGMCVAADARRRGIGSALLKEAIEAASRMGAHKVTLQVWPHNGPARRLYRRFGFLDEGRLRRHYRRRNGELWDAIIMGLVLDDERPGSSLPEDPSDDPSDDQADA